MKIAIKNGRIIDPANQLDKIADLAIAHGKIAHVGTLPIDFSPDKTIDAQNKWVIPGLVDVCCRPQVQHPQGATLHDEAFAAIQRGITSLCIPPDGDPIIDNTASTLRLKQQSDHRLPSIYPIGALTSQLSGTSIADLTALSQAGCIAFTNAQHPIVDLQILKNCYDYAATFDLLVIIQPQDSWLGKKGVAHEGFVATRLGLPGIPEVAETIAIAQHLLLVEQCNVRAHFTNLSTARGVQLIQEAKARGLKVSADTAMHLLHLTEVDVQFFDANCHVYPPLRSIEDCQGLLQGVANGTLDAICSDHRPLNMVAKLAPFGDTIPGMSTIDTYLALGLHLVHQKKLPLNRLIDALTYRPAQLFNLPAGTLSVDAAADICIIDPTQYWVVTEDSLLSKGKNTPFKQWEIPGQVTHTLSKGLLVHEA